MLLGILVLAAISVSAYTLSDNLGNWITSWYPLELGAGWVETFGTWLGGILIFLLGIILSKYIIMIVVSPFMSPMSQKIESNHPTTPSLPQTSLGVVPGIVRGLRIASGNIIKELFFTLVLLLLGIIIPFISPVTAILIFLIQAFYAGGGNMDFTLERYYGVKESKRFIRQNRGLAIGNGIVFMALLMLGLGFLVAPALGTLAVSPEVLDRIKE